MKRFKKVASIALVSAISVSMLAGCGTSGTASSAAASTPNASAASQAASSAAPASSAQAQFIVGFANNNDQYNYCAKFRDDLVKECQKQNIKLLVTDAKGDTNVQNGQIDDFIVQNAKIVSAISNDLDGSVPALESAKNANLPYVSFLTSVKDGDKYDKYIYIGSQNYDAGKKQGEYLAKALPQNAKVIYLTGQPNDQQYIDRKAGLKDALKSRTDIKWLSEYNTENKKDKGMSVTEDCLQAYSAFDAIICQNDDSALGAVEALKSANRMKGVITVGIDGSDAALQSIKAGELSVSILQNAEAQAKAGAEVFAKIRDGADPAAIKDIYVPFETITKDNVSEYLK